MPRLTIAVPFVVGLGLIVATSATATTINSSTYTITDLGGYYFGLNNTSPNFYGYHLSDSGVVSGYTLKFNNNLQAPARPGYLARYTQAGGGRPAVRRLATAYGINGNAAPNAGGAYCPAIYAPAMENSSGYWVYTDNNGTGHILSPSGNYISGWSSSNYANAINSAGLVGGGTAANVAYDNSGGTGELMTTGGSVPTPTPNGWVAAINDQGLALTGNGGLTAAYVDNTTGSGTTYWGTGNVSVGGSWYTPMAISQNGKYVVGQSNTGASTAFAPHLYTASGTNTGSSAVVNTSSLTSGGPSGTGWATAVNNNGWVGGDTDWYSDFNDVGWVWDGSTLHSSDIQTMIDSAASGYTFCAVWGVTDATNPQMLVWGRDRQRHRWSRSCSRRCPSPQRCCCSARA